MGLWEILLCQGHFNEIISLLDCFEEVLISKSICVLDVLAVAIYFESYVIAIIKWTPNEALSNLDVRRTF